MQPKSLIKLNWKNKKVSIYVLPPAWKFSSRYCSGISHVYRLPTKMFHSKQEKSYLVKHISMFNLKVHILILRQDN